MKTKEEILAEIIDIDRELIDFYWHSSDFITPYQACKAMQQYAEEYHQSEINKLNKSDVISSVSESGTRLDLDKILKSKDTFKNIL